MGSKRTMTLSFFALVCYLAAAPRVVDAQNVPQNVVANPNDFCTLPNAAVYVGGRFRHRDETVYYSCWRILGRDAQPQGVAWIGGEMRNNTFFIAKPALGGECTRPGNLRYSVGAVVLFGGSTYLCTSVFGQDLKPTGVAWVEVEVRDNNSFMIKGLP
jgi:hypothetical protein